ncbi:MAG: hypothetical protein K0S04_162 [Herbinix sp.]|jgi:DUF4097 and DUF4098 domain-containing protein YvlB/RNase P/RNase MRP subunit p29|nr:hypothetical protein [Herbinix sp.]
MRKLIIILISIFSIIIVGLIVLLVIMIGYGGFRINSSVSGYSNLKLVNTQNADLEGIEAIVIDYDSEDVVLYTSDTGELVLKEYMSFSPKEDDFTRITKSGGKLNLEGRKEHVNSWIFGMNRYSRMEIYLPSGYSGTLSVSTSSGVIDSDMALILKKFDASCSSGDIKMNEVTAEDINVSTSSGSITFKKAEGARSISSSSGDIEIQAGAGDTQVSSTSGSIIIENVVGQLKAEASSGDIVIKASSGKKDIRTSSGEIIITDSEGYTRAYASSGDLRITELAGAGDFTTTSGVVTVIFAKDASFINDNIKIESSSGDVDLTIPSELRFSFNANTSSGDIRTYFDDLIDFSKDERDASGTVGSSPLINLDISTTSGDIQVNSR